MSDASGPIILWRISDGKAGHDAQSRGLAEALARLAPCDVHDVPALSGPAPWFDLLARRFPSGRDLPDPDLIVGAGHDTHPTMLCARAARGGRTIVLMKPSLPLSWFDLCLVPLHDRPAARNNILMTRGALNRIVLSANKEPQRGLVLIGGPSRHYQWDPRGLIEQIENIAREPAVRWDMTDSARTPEATREALSALRLDNLSFTPHTETPPGWIADRLAIAAKAWVSEDSVSMIYEALTAGAAVGLLEVPASHVGRVTIGVRQLVEDGLVTRHANWRRGAVLKPPAIVLNESDRCAAYILDRFALPRRSAV